MPTAKNAKYPKSYHWLKFIIEQNISIFPMRVSANGIAKVLTDLLASLQQNNLVTGYSVLKKQSRNLVEVNVTFPESGGCAFSLIFDLNRLQAHLISPPTNPQPVTPKPQVTTEPKSDAYDRAMKGM